MQNVYHEVNSLDKRCYEEFYLNEDILMEHASLALYKYIKNKIKNNTKVLIIAGSGNNGADGIALSRLLYQDYNVTLVTPFDIKSNMAKIQMKRFEAIGGSVTQLENIKNMNFDIVVDCLFGSGLNKKLDEKAINLIEYMNNLKAKKIACDIPSGLDIKGNPFPICFKADITITMGSYKYSLFSDNAKDYIGDVKVANLGISRAKYEIPSKIKLLEKSDLVLPIRNKKSSHKGDFGHTCIVCGEKEGAAKLAAQSAFSFGCGLVTLLVHEKLHLDDFLMQGHKLPSNTTSIAIGMGLGNYRDEELEEIMNNNISKVIDADLFHDEKILKLLKDNIVLTPHPKEFVSLLKITKIADISVKELQEDRIKYVSEFVSKYKNIVLLLKGANTIIAKNDYIYINPLGSMSLSKGGSGDVLSGMIASLLSQGFNTLESAINASLAHAIASSNYKNNNYALNPIELIEEIKKI